MFYVAAHWEQLLCPRDELTLLIMSMSWRHDNMPCREEPSYRSSYSIITVYATTPLFPSSSPFLSLHVPLLCPLFLLSPIHSSLPTTLLAHYTHMLTSPPTPEPTPASLSTSPPASRERRRRRIRIHLAPFTKNPNSTLRPSTRTRRPRRSDNASDNASSNASANASKTIDLQHRARWIRPPGWGGVSVMDGECIVPL